MIKLLLCVRGGQTEAYPSLHERRRWETNAHCRDVPIQESPHHRANLGEHVDQERDNGRVFVAVDDDSHLLKPPAEVASVSRQLLNASLT